MQMLLCRNTQYVQTFITSSDFMARRIQTLQYVEEAGGLQSFFCVKS